MVQAENNDENATNNIDGCLVQHQVLAEPGGGRSECCKDDRKSGDKKQGRKDNSFHRTNSLDSARFSGKVEKKSQQATWTETACISGIHSPFAILPGGASDVEMCPVGMIDKF